jgi:Abortive infection C-terminus/PEP-CTERM motif
MRNIADKKRAGQEDADSDCLFGNGANNPSVDPFSATEFRSVHNWGSASVVVFDLCSGGVQAVLGNAKVQFPSRQLFPPGALPKDRAFIRFLDCSVDFRKARMNKIGDAHGQGKLAIKPKLRHAELVVNLAGTMASFLVSTSDERSARSVTGQSGSSVPEPSTWSMIAIGGVALLAMLHRRKRRTG